MWLLLILFLNVFTPKANGGNKHIPSCIPTRKSQMGLCLEILEAKSVRQCAIEELSYVAVPVWLDSVLLEYKIIKILIKLWKKPGLQHFTIVHSRHCVSLKKKMGYKSFYEKLHKNFYFWWIALMLYDFIRILEPTLWWLTIPLTGNVASSFKTITF